MRVRGDEMKCKIADLNVEIKNRNKYMGKLCKNYVSRFSNADLVLSASERDILREKSLSGGNSITTDAVAESMALCRKFGYALPCYDGFLLHAATFSVKNRGIALLAKSGTGKSTHMLLWQELFGNELQIINGDKPAVRIKNKIPLAYGTPWCGKEGLSVNMGVPLTDLCFIVRSESNHTELIEKHEALNLILDQIIVPSGSDNIVKTLGLIDLTVSHCRIWKIFCNTDIEAAEVSSRTILGVK